METYLHVQPCVRDHIACIIYKHLVIFHMTKQA